MIYLQAHELFTKVYHESVFFMECEGLKSQNSNVKHRA